MNKHLLAKVCNVKTSGSIHVMLEDNDVDVNQEMLNAGFAERLIQKMEPPVSALIPGQHQQMPVGVNKIICSSHR